MMYYLFQIQENISTEAARHDLEKQGLKDIFIIEDDATGEILIGGHSTKPIGTKNAILVERKPATVDWEEQWVLFAENFKEGKAQIHLAPFGADKTLFLTPGPGFGDLSHPTTYLMLEMMQHHVAGENIVDIGTGSGILALAALLLGAKSALGIDIDPAAIKHAKENGRLNHLQATFSKSFPKKLPPSPLFLMNMILSDQQHFNPKDLKGKLWITSGILAQQKKSYLAQAKKWNWQLVSEYQRSDWLGFIFIT